MTQAEEFDLTAAEALGRLNLRGNETLTLGQVPKGSIFRADGRIEFPDGSVSETVLPTNSSRSGLPHRLPTNGARSE